MLLLARLSPDLVSRDNKHGKVHKRWPPIRIEWFEAARGGAQACCRPPIEMSPLSPFQMSLSSPDGCWERVTDDGDCDEPHGDRSDARAQGSGSWPDYGE